MKTWTITNQKGGVGKTTSVVTLGGLLAGSDKRVLLVDLDPHGSLTSYFRLDPDEIEYSVYNLFKKMVAKEPLDPTPLIQTTSTPGLDLLPASTTLATLDRQVGIKDGMGLVLATALKKLETEYSYALIDTPPMLGVLMVNALAACNHLLVPVQTEFLALKGLERMLHTLGMIFKSTQREISYTVVPTLFDRRTKASMDSLRALRETYPNNTWESTIPVDTRFRDASSAGVPPSVFAPNTRGVAAYQTLLESLLEQQGE